MLKSEENERSAWNSFWLFIYMLPGYLLLLASVGGLVVAAYTVLYNGDTPSRAIVK